MTKSALTPPKLWAALRESVGTAQLVRYAERQLSPREGHRALRRLERLRHALRGR